MSTRYQAVQKSPFFLCSYFVFKRLYPQGTGAGLLGLTVFCSAAFEYCKPSPAPLSFSSISRGSISRLFGGKQDNQEYIFLSRLFGDRK